MQKAFSNVLIILNIFIMMNKDEGISNGHLTQLYSVCMLKAYYTVHSADY